MTNKKLIQFLIEEFLIDYNTLISECNEELSGIDDAEMNLEAKTFEEVNYENIRFDEYLSEEYYEILRLQIK